MNPIDHDLRGLPIYDPLDLAIQAAPLPVFDLDRMHQALSGPFMAAPKGLSREEMRAFLLAHNKAGQ